MRRMAANSIEYCEVEIFGNPAIFTSQKIEHGTVPKGAYLYEIRHADQDWSTPCQLGEHILVNYYGAVITNMPIQLSPDGLLDFEDKDFLFSEDESYRTLEEFMEKYPSVEKDMIKLFILKTKEKDLFFSQTEEKDEENGCIGHLRGNFGKRKQFFITWVPHQKNRLNTEQFQTDLRRVMFWLRQGQGPLRDLHTMRRFCELRKRNIRLPQAMLPFYGFCIHTKRYQYMLRCIPVKGEHHFYIYCYDKEAQKRKTALHPAEEHPRKS